jgi:energy-coupling factor transporter ATP-binding protein EcfA2
MAIVFKDFSFRFNGTENNVLQDINLTVEQGEFVVLVGSGGSGKSTLIHCINGIIPHFIKGTVSGSLTVDGLDTKTTATIELTKKVGIVFQNAEMQFFTTTVEEELALSLENKGMPPKEILERIDWALELTKMQDYRYRPLYALSGGQKQLIAIASILVMRPNILLLDEPTANLDPAGSERVYSVVCEIQKQAGSTIIMIDHKMQMLLETIGPKFRMIALKDGRVLAEGTPEQILCDIDMVNKIGLKVLPMVEVYTKLIQRGVQVEPFLTVYKGNRVLHNLLRGMKSHG